MVFKLRKLVVCKFSHRIQRALGFRDNMFDLCSLDITTSPTLLVQLSRRVKPINEFSQKHALKVFELREKSYSRSKQRVERCIVLKGTVSKWFCYFWTHVSHFLFVAVVQILLLLWRVQEKSRNGVFCLVHCFPHTFLSFRLICQES